MLVGLSKRRQKHMSIEDSAFSERSKSEIVIRRYGLLDPIDWGADCENELERMVFLWNKLVDIHEKYVALYHAEIAKDDALSAAKNEYEKLCRDNAASSVISTAKRKLAIIQKEVSRRMAFELSALEMNRREEVKVARQNSDLWWGNYNAVVRAFENARSAAVRGGNTLWRRATGGNGRFTNTLQKAPAVEHVFDGTLNQVMVRRPPDRAWSAERRGERRQLQRTVLTATVFVRSGERRTVTWPMVMHRPLPSDSRVKNVIVTRRRITGRWKWAVSFACAREVDQEPRSAAGSKLIAVDVGWRLVSEGLRVATIMASGDEPQFVTLPPELLKSFAFVDELRERAATSARIGIELLHATDAAQFEQPFHNLLVEFQRKQEKKFHHLSEFCRSEFFTVQSKGAVGSKIGTWRFEYIKLITWLSNQQRKIVARRNHLYQNIAISVLDNASSVVVKDMKFGEIATRSERKSEGPFFPRRANYYRTIAAPSTFVRCLKLQAYKRRIAFSKGELTAAAGCPDCGSTTSKSRADAFPRVCSNCGTRFDQDVATCRMLLLSAGKLPLTLLGRFDVRR